MIFQNLSAAKKANTENRKNNDGFCKKIFGSSVILHLDK